MVPLLRFAAALALLVVHGAGCGRPAPSTEPEPELAPDPPAVATYSQVQTDRMKWASPKAHAPGPTSPAHDLESPARPGEPAARILRSAEPAGPLHFESTYLGGDALHELLATRLDAALGAFGQPHRLASAVRQPLDAPEGAALTMAAALDHAWTPGPARVVLQVALRAADVGAKRPPIAVGLILLPDGDPEAVAAAATALASSLGPSDRLSVVIAGEEPELVIRPERPASATHALARALAAHREAPAAEPGAERHLAQAIYLSGRLLQEAPAPRIAVRSVVVIGASDESASARRGDGQPLEQAAEAATHLARQGLSTSVVELSETGPGRLWRVASGGRGAFKLARPLQAAAAVVPLVAQLGGVVARDLRLEVRLAPGHRVVRVLGSPLLPDLESVAADGAAGGATVVETRIPAFLAGDDHVILIEVDVAGPGPVAEASLTWVDLARQAPGKAQVAAALADVKTPDSPAQRLVRANTRAVALAEQLARAAEALRSGEVLSGARVLKAARRLAQATTRTDLRMVDAFYDLLTREAITTSPERLRLVSDALLLASRRKLGHCEARAEVRP